MGGSNKRQHGLRGMLAALALVGCLGATGCQVDVGGQTLPSPYYLTDDVQYFPAGPEFVLSREAAAMKARSPQGIPPAIRENIPPAVQENVPPAVQENVPPAAPGNVPPAAQGNVPGVAPANVPPPAPGNVPPPAPANGPPAPQR
jgi:hypothetical protein